MVFRPSNGHFLKAFILWKYRRGSGVRLHLFILGIQMDAYTNHGGHERVMLFCMDHHPGQAVIIKNPIIDPLCCRALVIDFL